MNKLTLKMIAMRQYFEYLKDEQGQDLVEYALLVALVAVGATAGMKPLATAINSAFGSVTSTLNAALS